ncbi:MAG: 16S rRNA (cytosine(1402)-N(4))-methyltransferase RsmH [Fusobacteriaceae bacterium]
MQEETKIKEDINLEEDKNNIKENENNFQDYHIPVLYAETLDNLVINPDGVYVDCTLGGGGHSEGILKRLSSKGVLISIDQDDKAIEYAKKRLGGYKNWKVFKNNFENIDTVIYTAGYDKVDGILMDIGVSSTQLDDPERGFSYRYDTRLDMRMNNSAEISAYEVVNNYEEGDLSKIFFEYGEERHARRIARLICESRKEKPIETTGDLVTLIKRAYPERATKHPAKKTFQAIRIEVNKELEVLETAINKSIACLNKKGRMGIITFHSLEDRIVKTMFKEYATGCICPPKLPMCVCNHVETIKLVTKKPIVPGNEEIGNNKRARSSKLRIVERI